MSGSFAIDEAALVWAAAVLDDVDPVEVLVAVDVAALAAVVAEAEVPTEPVDAAATLLAEMVRRRPFPASNAAIAWLATVDLLAGSQRRVTADPAAVVELCRSVGAGVAGPADVAAALRTWVVEDGLACPACGRRVYALDPLARRLVAPPGARHELTARCALEHRAHDRSGRPIAPPTARPAQAPQPILASGACGSFLVAEEAGSVAVSPFCDDPPLVRVVAVGDLRAGDLVGRWDALIERSTTLGFVAADDAAPDERGRVDLARLRRALRAGGRPPAGAARQVPAPHRVGSSS